MQMASIKIKDVAKKFGNLTVMQNISFDIEDGEFVVLVGPSGCGKSTLLRILSGLEEASSGEIYIGDKMVNNVPARERDIAMVFQSYALYPHMNVAENMGFSLRIDGESKAKIAKKVAEVAEILELTSLLKRKPGKLSGGQRQRVAMGRAIVRDPQVFLFDEPLSNLDAKLRVQMRAEITALQNQLKTTTVYVTHDQIEAMTMADRIVVLRDGRVEQVGRPLDLFDTPANIFVAQFIGSPQMNLVHGKTENRDGTNVFVAGDFTLVLPSKYDEHAGKDVVLGFRPNEISVRETLDEGDCSATLKTIEATGTETMVTMDLDGFLIRGVFNERLTQQVGDLIHIRIDPRTCHLFDQKTEKRL